MSERNEISWTAVSVIVSIVALCATIAGFGFAMLSSVQQVEKSLSDKITQGDEKLADRVSVVQSQLAVVVSSQIRDLPQRIAILEQANSEGERYTRSDAETRIARETAEFERLWAAVRTLEVTTDTSQKELRSWLRDIQKQLATAGPVSANP